MAEPARRALLAVCVAASLLLAAGGAGAQPVPKPAAVSVNDFYFGPAALRIAKGGAVKWVWSPLNDFAHDVHLESGPAGLKRKGSYSSEILEGDARFQRSFATPGTYKFLCTLHPTEMKLTVTVKR